MRGLSHWSLLWRDRQDQNQGRPFIDILLNARRNLIDYS